MNTRPDVSTGHRPGGGHRRALAAGAVVAVLGTALVGGAALVAPQDAPPTVAGTTVQPAAGGTASTPIPESTTGTENTHAATDPATVVEAAPAALEGAAGTDTDHGDPPWQDDAPPLPEGGMQPENPDWPNAWEIPDARPTGIDLLDRLGAPKLGMNYPRMVPVSGVMVCNTGADDVEPLAGQDWFYYEGDGTGLDSASVDIVVTGWEDSTAARDALRDDTMTFCVRDTAGGWQQLEWSEHVGDDDYLLYEAASQTQLDHGFAIVRQGDYVVGVTVTDADGGADPSVAGEIAAKTADNLEVLDPVHGRD